MSKKRYMMSNLCTGFEERYLLIVPNKIDFYLDFIRFYERTVELIIRCKLHKGIVYDKLQPVF